MLSINRSSYTYYETGVATPNIYIVKFLARLYNVTINYILGITDNNFDYDLGDLKEEEIRLVSLVRDQLITTPELDALIDQYKIDEPEPQDQ